MLRLKQPVEKSFPTCHLNFVLIRSAFKLKNSVEVKDQPNAEGLRFFALTIFYLFSLFSALLIDNLILL